MFSFYFVCAICFLHRKICLFQWKNISNYQHFFCAKMPSVQKSDFSTTKSFNTDLSVFIPCSNIRRQDGTDDEFVTQGPRSPSIYSKCLRVTATNVFVAISLSTPRFIPNVFESLSQSPFVSLNVCQFVYLLYICKSVCLMYLCLFAHLNIIIKQ